MKHLTLVTKASKEYELIDSGHGEKLERYGEFVLARPDPQALFEKRLLEREWKKAHGWYERQGKTGTWHTKQVLPKEWPISFGGIELLVRPTSFKHTGLFPEQLPHWEWAAEKIATAGRPVSVLNLFAYTGGATLSAAKAGASVTHVDASKSAVAWAKENAVLSNLSEKPVRWLIDDVTVFLKREVKRGNTYDAIIMDPPAFGHGPKDELWKIEEDFLSLMKLCHSVLSEKPLFMLVSGYAAGYSPIAFLNNLEPLTKKYGGTVEYGEVALEESVTARLLPAGIFARWSV